MRTPSVAGASAVTGAVCGSALTSGLGRMSQAAAAADTGLSLRSTSSFRIGRLATTAPARGSGRRRLSSLADHSRRRRAASHCRSLRLPRTLSGLHARRCATPLARCANSPSHLRGVRPSCAAGPGWRGQAPAAPRRLDMGTLVVAGTRLRIDRQQTGQSRGRDDRQFSSMRHRILPSPRRWMRHITRFSDGLTLTQMGNCHAIRGRNAAVRGRVPR